MKVCDIVQFFSPISGGVKRYILDKSPELARRGIEHMIIVPSHRTRERACPHARIFEIRSPRLPGSASYRCLLSARAIRRVIERERPDLIETGDPYRAAWIALQTGRRMNIPVVAFYHSNYLLDMARSIHRFLGPAVERRVASAIRGYVTGLYGRMDATVASTRRVYGELAAAAIPRLRLVRLGVNTSVFRPRPSRAAVRGALGLPEGIPLLLYAGRLAREKNIDSLLALPAVLRTVGCRAHLLIVGEGELADGVRRHASFRRGLTWWPYCGDAARLADYYSAADLFVHAGTQETFGLASAEAQACGTRVVAVRGGGLDETIEGERPEITAANERSLALARAVLECLQLDEGPDHRAARAARIARDFSIGRTVEELVRLYQVVLRARGAPVQGTSKEVQEDVVESSTVYAR